MLQDILFCTTAWNEAVFVGGVTVCEGMSLCVCAEHVLTGFGVSASRVQVWSSRRAPHTQLSDTVCGRSQQLVQVAFLKRLSQISFDFFVVSRAAEKGSEGQSE